MTTESLAAVGLQFLEKYLRENPFPLTRHHIDSYEQCVFEQIPSIIQSRNPLIFLKGPLDKEGTEFANRVEVYIGGKVNKATDLALTIAPPVVALDGGNTVRRLFPNEARLRKMTYGARISANIEIRVTFTKPSEKTPGTYEQSPQAPVVIPNFPLVENFPILLRSALCVTGVSDPVRLTEMGECRNDYGGYFIIGGQEKVLITRGEQAFNSLYVERKPENSPDGMQSYASVVSLDPKTKQTRRVALYMLRDGEIRVSVPMVRGAFPLFILFRALGIESDEEIVRMIFPDREDPLATELVPSIEDAYPIYNRYTATKYIMTLTKGFTEAHVLDILRNLMLAHVPNEPLTRAQYLAEMARECIRAKAGLRTKTDRDDMRNQRFLPTGTLVRELFNGCYKDWVAAVTLSVDRTYRANEQNYQGAALFNLFSENNLGALFQPELLSRSIMRGFRGQWGTNPMNTKSGVLQPLARISYLDALSHTRRVVSDFDTTMKTTGPRKLHTSQIGYFCTSETPTGAHIGATKNMSIMTQFSLEAEVDPVLQWLKAKGGLIPVAATTANLRMSAVVVQINGGTVGFTTEPEGLVRTLRLLKWTAYLSPTASIAFNTKERAVYITLDEGRPVRPLWHIGGEGAAFLERVPALLKKSWAALVFGTLNDGANLRTVQFVDPLADQPAAAFADYETALAPHIGLIEYCDPMEMNEAYIAWWGGEEVTPEHTHAEIHPSTMTGLMASMIPFSNHNQAPRNQLSNSQSKQGIGYMATNIHNRYDTYASQLCYGEAPLCRTFYYENIANGEMPYGFNCIIAATSESGYNQDDGLIINRDSVARGMFQSLSLRSYDCAEETDTRSKTHSHIANPVEVPAWTALRPGLDYSKLDERGIIREGELVDEHTVLVGRYMVIPETGEVKDASVTPGLMTDGRVESVVVLHQANGHLLVRVRVIKLRVPGLGDKFSSRHGQKGTIGMLVSAADMPRTAEGLVPDVMVNPGGLISRMTVAQLVEMVAGRVAAETVSKMNATTFCNGGEFVQQLGDVLEQLGASRGGDNILYSGISGKQLQTDIFMCPLYFMRLKHLTEDKVNARGQGRREIRTHQPTGGRANEGGLRIGEMESNSLCAHGISLFLTESMMKRGDATDFWVCNGCGRMPIYNESEQLFVCPTCDGPLTFNGVNEAEMTLQLPTKQSRATFSRIAMPYAMKLLDQELSTFGNMGFRYLTESTIARLRESDWPWAAEPVEFEVGEGVEQLAEKAAPVVVEKPKRKEMVAATESTAVKVPAPAPVVGVDREAEVLAAAYAPRSNATEPVAIFFSNKEGSEYEGLSNYATAPFRLPGKQAPAPDGTRYLDYGVDADGSVNPAKQTWPTVEHFYQAMKFPQEPEWQEAIRTAPTAARAKKVGLDRGHAPRGDWDRIKDKVMKMALQAKFQQNPSLTALLQSTGDMTLVFESTGDPYWGATSATQGRNRLGFMLMDLRKVLKDMRVDQTVLETAVPNTFQIQPDNDVKNEEASSNIPEAPTSNATNAEETTVTKRPEEVVAEAKEVVNVATRGVVQMEPMPETNTTQPPPPQQGGVYLFINPGDSGVTERLKAARSRSSGRRRITWDGVGQGGVSQEGGEEGGYEEAAQEGGNGPTEVVVEKLN